jgi:ABC-type branched-subunit amino acid transport system substrate-binding protein
MGKKKWNWLIIISGVIMAIGVAFFTVSILFVSHEKNSLYEQFAYCPEKRGRPGVKIGDRDICFRNLKTSGEVGAFLSSTNFHLEKGSKAFQDKDYLTAIKLFEQAVDGDRSDPVPQIFLNNAKARQRGKSLGLEPIKLAVVASIDYYEIAAKDVLRGVADAQNKFNESQGEQAPLMEIVVTNDENEPEAARKVAQELVDDPSILGIIGHHASESTTAAQPIYEKAKIAVVSPTSSSSQLKGEQFFRAVGGTKKAAKKYVDYIRKELGLDKIVVFYKKGSEYSETLKNNFMEDFSKNGGIVTTATDIGSDTFDIKTEIKHILDNKVKALLIISNVRTNSIAIEIAIAINRRNATLPLNQKIKLLGVMALSEEETLDKGGKAVEGIILVRPCLSPKYTQDAAERWQEPENSWRTATSYDATQAFSEAIKLSKVKQREDILRQLQSPSFSLSKEQTSGFGLNWDLSDLSNANRKYCVVQIKDGKFRDITEDSSNTPVRQNK